ncbi:MAG: hypothetical protein B7Z51_00150 [Methyloversatilis sp. 12-65-5]|nr:MAG: hypothetical protein B7Z51_00150 [Methyloversatilis sp. 12-65-5]
MTQSPHNTPEVQTKASALFAPAALAAALSFSHAANAAVNVTLQPDEASNKGATINLYGVPALLPFESPSAEHPVTTDLFQVLNPWNGSSVTWETAPMTVMTASSSTVQNSVDGWISFDATSLVRSWLDNPSSNYGVLLAQRGVVEFDVDGNSRYVGAQVVDDGHALFDRSMAPSLRRRRPQPSHSPR